MVKTIIHFSHKILWNIALLNLQWIITVIPLLIKCTYIYTIWADVIIQRQQQKLYLIEIPNNGRMSTAYRVVSLSCAVFIGSDVQIDREFDFMLSINYTGNHKETSGDIMLIKHSWRNCREINACCQSLNVCELCTVFYIVKQLYTWVTQYCAYIYMATKHFTWIHIYRPF